MNRTIAKNFGIAAFAAVMFSAMPLFAADAQVVDLTQSLVQAGAQVTDLRAVEVGGVVVLRGRSVDAAAAQQAAVLVQGLGYTRIANLIVVATPVDDEAIERFAERKLGLDRGLEGCQIQIDSDHGIVTLNGKVMYELQKDMAIHLVRSIRGVKSVQAAMLTR